MTTWSEGSSSAGAFHVHDEKSREVASIPNGMKHHGFDREHARELVALMIAAPAMRAALREVVAMADETDNCGVCGEEGEHDCPAEAARHALRGID